MAGSLQLAEETIKKFSLMRFCFSVPPLQWINFLALTHLIFKILKEITRTHGGLGYQKLLLSVRGHIK